MAATDPQAIQERPAELLRDLLRFETTNPPGNERPCIAYIEDLLRAAGCETRLVSRDPERPNLVARLPGAGSAPPLLLYGHIDVVTTAGQRWTHAPFAGELVDDLVWGRGALDMKGGVAMLVAAFLRAKAAGLEPAGDVVLAVLVDEEAGGNFGARFLVENHAELFAGIKHAIGEFGGFTIEIGGKRFYPIQVAEKQACWLKATLRGPGGHGSQVMRGGAMASLAEMLRKLDRGRLPVHVTPVVRETIEAVARNLGFPQGAVLRAMLRPRVTDRVLDLLGERGRIFEPLVHNTVNAVMVKGGAQINVIPSEIEVSLDGRVLPGFGAADLIGELRALVGDDPEIEVLLFDPYPAEPDMELFETLAQILRDADPHGTPVPMVLSAVTDGRFFARLGIQTYGFLPMQLPAGLDFTRLIHGADERVPAAAIEFGTAAVYEALRRYH